MENASKALIIAGAILLSILLISLGIYIFTGAQDTVKNSGLDAQQVSTFNAAIVKYEGKNKSAADVRSVRNEVIAANRKLKNEGTKDEELIKMTRNGGTAESASTFDTSDLDDSNKKYTIKLTYGDNGYISNVDVSYKTN